MDLFNILPENFFSILASKNKRLYAACIFQVFKAYEQSSIMGIDKKIIVDDLSDFLDKYFALADTENEYVDEDEENFDKDLLDKSKTREIANEVLRKFEKAGWIFIEVDNDYIETLNFTDGAITIIESLSKIKVTGVSSEVEDDFDSYSPEEFNGYVFTIYSLLNTSKRSNSLLILNEVLKNTRALVNYLRKMDFRLRQYISSVVSTTDIKGLMDRLIKYKTEIFDEAYNRIKTNDNINKFRLEIVKNLEKMLDSNMAMKEIIEGYKKQYGEELATKQVFKDINEIIDTFNTLDDNISEIDIKIKTYINATIGKVKFLLNEEDNIIGKLNLMLKHIKNNASDDKKLKKAIDLVSSTTTLRISKGYSKKGLYSGRGAYVAPTTQTLDTSYDHDFVLGAAEIFKSTTNKYSEDAIRKYMDEVNKTNSNELVGSELINYDSTDEEILTLVHAIIYSNENGYKVHKRDDLIDHSKFLMVNFTLRKEG